MSAGLKGVAGLMTGYEREAGNEPHEPVHLLLKPEQTLIMSSQTRMLVIRGRVGLQGFCSGEIQTSCLRLPVLIVAGSLFFTRCNFSTLQSVS